MPEFDGFHYLEARAELGAAPLLVLHGSGMSENDLLQLADAVAPDRPLLSIRGSIPWEDGYAFFRRNADRSLDELDLKRQTEAMCSFIAAALSSGLLKKPPILLGYSNGAIMVASILHRQPDLAKSAILLRPLSPAPAERFPDLAAKPVQILSAEHDPRRAPEDALLVTQQLSAAGARVEAHRLPIGHELHASETILIRDFLQAQSE
jgi:phospholipase/carboxylesterase